MRRHLLDGLLGHGVREFGVVSLEEAVHQLTDVPARLYGLRGRGRIADGYAADAVLLDPATVGYRDERIRDDLPGGAWRLYAEADGIHRVLVNGVAVVDDAAFTGALRHPAPLTPAPPPAPAPPPPPLPTNPGAGAEDAAGAATTRLPRSVELARPTACCPGRGEHVDGADVIEVAPGAAVMMPWRVDQPAPGGPVEGLGPQGVVLTAGEDGERPGVGGGGCSKVMMPPSDCHGPQPAPSR